MFNRIMIAIKLWLLLPFAIGNIIKNNLIKTVVPVIGIAIMFFIVAYKKPLHIVDVTPAFNNNNLKKHKTEYVVIHHTAGNPDGCINDIIKVHYGQHGWSSIGYHFFIDTDGTIYQLRNTDENVPHSYHYNDNSVAICLNGNLSKYKPTDEQWNSTMKLVRQMLEKYGLTKESVFKHGQLHGNNTECCGKLFDVEKFKKEL